MMSAAHIYTYARTSYRDFSNPLGIVAPGLAGDAFDYMKRNMNYCIKQQTVLCYSSTRRVLQALANRLAYRHPRFKHMQYTTGQLFTVPVCHYLCNAGVAFVKPISTGSDDWRRVELSSSRGSSMTAMPATFFAFSASAQQSTQTKGRV
jgi:hypothetical protein